MAEAAARRRLVRLYAAMAAHTEPECGVCARPHSCCEERYCLLAIDFARDYWGVELEPGWHPSLPLMGPTGCTVPPHLRPICTMHTCAVSEHGCKPGDPAWTARYVELREAIEAIQAELFPDAPV